MIDVLDEKDRVARKKHICDLCGGTIEKDETYRWERNVQDGDFYTMKTHKCCLYLAEYFELYKLYDGLTVESFRMEIMDAFKCLSIAEKAEMLFDYIKKQNEKGEKAND